MGGTLTAPEEAIHLLRRAGFPALATHWLGSAPFALSVLFFWNYATDPRSVSSKLALGSLGLAMLLLWMSYWRAVSAGILRRRLAHLPDLPWTAGRACRLMSGQAILAATRLVIFPLSALILFPLARTVAFYRFAAVVGGAEDRHPLDTIALARRLASRQNRDEWLVVPLLVLLAILVLLNVVTGLGVLPQLVRMLTGYESEFSRSGIHFVSNPLFWLTAAALGWLAFDPFVQAVYCVLCFRAESAETGEDVRAGLRRLRAPGPIAAALLLALVVAIPASAQVSKPELRNSIRQAMQAHEYDWRLPPEAAAGSKPSAFVDLTDRILARVHSMLDSLGSALGRFFKWLFEKLGFNQPSGKPGMPGSSGLQNGVWILIVVSAAGLAYLAWRVPWRNLRRRAPAAVASLTPVRLDSESLTPADLPEERWLELAESCERDGNLRFALRALYLANLAWLGRLEFISIHAGKTNHEYESELRRRTRALPEARRLFSANIEAFERAWYGTHQVDAEDLAAFRQRFAEMKPILSPVREVAA